MVLSEAIRFVSSELGNRSEVASLSAREEINPSAPLRHDST